MDFIARKMGKQTPLVKKIAPALIAMGGFMAGTGLASAHGAAAAMIPMVFGAKNLQNGKAKAVADAADGKTAQEEAVSVYFSEFSKVIQKIKANTELVTGEYSGPAPDYVPSEADQIEASIAHENWREENEPNFRYVTQKSVDRTREVYDSAKTVADCFKYRHKIGLAVAVEALREGWGARKFTLEQLAESARICRVRHVIQPYLEMLT